MLRLYFYEIQANRIGAEVEIHPGILANFSQLPVKKGLAEVIENSGFAHFTNRIGQRNHAR